MKQFVFLGGLVLLALAAFHLSDSPQPGRQDDSRPGSGNITGFAPTAKSGMALAPNAEPVLDLQGASWPMFRGAPGISGRVPLLPIEPLKPIWRHNTGAPVRAGPVVAGGRVYVVNQKGSIVFLDLTSGKPLRQFCLCQPTVATGLLLSAGKEELFVVGTKKGTLHAFSTATGESRYQFSTSGEIIGGATGLVTASGSRVLFGSHDSCLYCLDGETGALLFKVETDNAINGTPAWAGDMFLIGGCDGFLRGIAPDSGKEMLAINLGSYIPSSPAYADHIAYVALHENRVMAVDLASGSIKWQFQPEGKGEFFAPPAVAEKHVVAAAADGRIHVLAKETGETTGTVSVSGKLEADPLVDANHLLLADLDGFLGCFSLETRKLVWKIEHGSGIAAPPAVFARHLLIADLDGWVTLYGPSDEPGLKPPISPKNAK
jgi:outer membrane protein assembly factor BamB